MNVEHERAGALADRVSRLAGKPAAIERTVEDLDSQIACVGMLNRHAVSASAHLDDHVVYFLHPDNRTCATAA